MSESVSSDVGPTCGVITCFSLSHSKRTGSYAAVTQTFGPAALVQRCQVHKRRNVLEYLPESQRPWVKAILTCGAAPAIAGHHERHREPSQPDATCEAQREALARGRDGSTLGRRRGAGSGPRVSASTRVQGHAPAGDGAQRPRRSAGSRGFVADGCVIVNRAAAEFQQRTGQPRRSSRDFRFACPRWPLYTPEGRPAPETLVRHSIVPLQRPSAQPVVTCGRLEALCSRHFSDTAPHVGHFFANRTALPVPRVSLPAPAAPRSAATCRRTAAGLDVLPPAGASRTWHASRAGPRSSPAAAGDS